MLERLYLGPRISSLPVETEKTVPWNYFGGKGATKRLLVPLVLKPGPLLL